MKIVCAEDCGNAPKKLLLRNLIIDHWSNDGRMMVDSLADEAVWSVAGGPRNAGKEAILGHLARGRDGEPTELHIHDIITHGNTASANLTVTMQDGSRVEYCDVYRFGGFGSRAKIKEITSYVIRIH